MRFFTSDHHFRHPNIIEYCDRPFSNVEEMEEELIRRAIQDPKPMYYRESFLDQKLAEYLKQEGLESADEIEPNRFVQWIFPKLLEHRRPLYEALAEQHGYTVDARETEQVNNEADFLNLVASAIRSAS